MASEQLVKQLSEMDQDLHFGDDIKSLNEVEIDA